MKSFRPINEHLVEVTLEVQKSDNGLRLDQFIKRYFARMSRERVQTLIKESVRNQNGNYVKQSYSVKPGERYCWNKTIEPEDDDDLFLDIIHEDERLIALNKPAGLLVHPTVKVAKRTITSLLKQYDLSCKIAHRLDKDTSGVLLCGKNTHCHRYKLFFSQHRIQKTYLAIVRGRPNINEQVIDFPLKLDTSSDLKVKMCVDKLSGAEAITHVQLIASSGDYSLVRCSPKTGRQHQIRIHLHAIGHTIVGDKLYGTNNQLFRDIADSGMTETLCNHLGAYRHLLHASELAFIDEDGHPYRFTAPVPDDMATFISHMTPI